jgi:hypothetical protein
MLIASQSVDVILMTIIGDSILIYRCFIIWDRSFLVITPSLALAATGIGLVVTSIYLQTTQVVSSSDGKFTSPYKEVQISLWTMTIGINVLTTGMGLSLN